MYFKNIVFIVHEFFLLKGVTGEMSNFSYPVLSGRILNRFCKDIGLMDDLLPLTFQDLIQVTKQSCQSSHRE